MKVSYHRPTNGLPFYRAEGEGPLRRIMVEGSTRGEALLVALTKYKEQATEKAERTLEAVK